jgi:hypothetical protein
MVSKAPLSLLFGLLGAVLGVSLDAQPASASDCAGGPGVCGKNSGLVPFHKDAIHASLIWDKKNSRCPKMLIWMRPSEYKPSHYLNPTVGAAFSGFNETYIRLVQGGFSLGQLDESGWSRYAPDLERENAQLIDVCGLQALIDRGTFTKTSIADLTDEDIRRTDPFFKDAGFSRGLGYNLFCDGHVAGVDGRLYGIGGHDKGGNNGIRKIIIFDPETEQWLPRPVPCVRSQFEADPDGADPHCNPLDERNTDPPHPSDMKYQRWYPTGVTLPDSRILILSGTDQDTSVGPADASATKVRQAVPEVYDPSTDRNIVLENARKLFNMYPRSFVTQTGPGKDDWKVCVAGGVVQPPLPGTPGGPDITDYDPFHYNGETYCLDVQAALADPKRNVPGENHWGRLIDTADDAHDSGAAVRLVTINADGTSSQKVFLFGGNSGVDADDVATAEMIDFSDPEPQWQVIDPLALPATQNNAVVLPDGHIVVFGGRASGVNSLHYQMYDPDGRRTNLIESPVPRHDHSTALVLPNGGVWVMGGNRVNLTEPPGGGQTQEQRDLAVPVLEYYQPPYFFKGGERPVIHKAPAQIDYGQNFKLDVSEAAGEIASVALLRTGPITHNWSWGNQYVRLPFAKEKDGKLSITAPPLPGLAIAGDYLLFVVRTDGVPSEGKHIFLSNDRR